MNMEINHSTKMPCWEFNTITWCQSFNALGTNPLLNKPHKSYLTHFLVSNLLTNFLFLFV